MAKRYQAGDRVVLWYVGNPAPIGTVKRVEKRKRHLMGDRLLVMRDDGVKGSGKDGEWITNEYGVREALDGK